MKHLLTVFICLNLSCAGLTDARKIEIDHRGYCFTYMREEKEITFCADSKFSCEGMRQQVNNRGWKLTSECSLY